MDGKVRHSTAVPAYGFIVAVAAVISTLAFSLTDTTTDLTPGHDEFVLTIGFIAAVATALVVFTLILWLRPPLRIPRLVGAPLLALAAALIAGLLTFTAADRITQALEFQGYAARYQQMFLIDRAYISHGKGVSYHIQISEPFADFLLSPDDYRGTFGNSDELRSTGDCLRASVERRGKALRIMYPTGRPIPAGQVRPCSASHQRSS